MKLRTVHVQETSSRQKADRLPKVRTFGVVVSPEDVLQRFRVRKHENVLLPTSIVEMISDWSTGRERRGQMEWNGLIPQSILLRARRSHTQPSI